METERVNTDQLLHGLGGCGCFQVMMASLAYLPQIAFAFSMLFMSFGAYNPGWKCLDAENRTYVTSNTTSYATSYATSSVTTTSDVDINNGGGSGGGGLSFKNNEWSIFNNNSDNTLLLYSEYNTEMKCDDYQACKSVQFNPEASTIVTEWGLVCESDWVPITMMSLQMIGVLVGALINGFLGDKFGRKKTLYSFVSINIALNFISIFSVSWKMYIALRFLLGLTCGIIGYTPCIFITEFVPPKWRVRISSLPFWSMGAMLFSVVAMVTKDWRHIHISSAIVSTVALLPVYWVPESLRWSMVHGKNKKAWNIAKKIAYWNHTIVPSETLNELIFMIPKGRHKENGTSKTTTILDLFKRSTIKFTFVFGLLFLSIDLVYYATSFGISSLPGNLYTNFFILFATEMPSNLVSSTIPNLFGRRIVLIISYGLKSVCLFGVVAIELLQAFGQTKLIITLVLIVTARLCLCVEWYIILAFISEVYPTVVRNTAASYGGLMAGCGSILAPYLIPSEPSKRFIGYLIMAVLTLVCCLLVPLLPETKDEPLHDTWDKQCKELQEGNDPNEHGKAAEDETSASIHNGGDNLDGDK